MTIIAEYKAAPEFTRLAPTSRRAYLIYIELIEDAFGDLPLAALADRRVRGEFKSWRDSFVETPRKADYAWTTLARIMSFAKDRGTIATNPCEKGGRLYVADRTDKVWGEQEIAGVLAVAPEQIKLAPVPALWTGQRQGDLLRLPWSSYDGTHIRLRQSKTGRRIAMPAGAPLKALLDTIERRGPLILTNSYGRPWTSDGFRTSWSKICARAGVSGLTFHDLRGNGGRSVGYRRGNRAADRDLYRPQSQGRRGNPRCALSWPRHSARRSCGAEARTENQNCKMTCKMRPAYCVACDAKLLKSLVVCAVRYEPVSPAIPC
jgi:integrase